MKLTKHNNDGFTLIELILYVALVSMVVTGAVIFGWDVINARQKSMVEQTVIASARLASRRINYEIRNASGVNSVSLNSISLANTNTSLNPTIIDVTGGRVRIGYGSSGSCPTSSPCFLTPSNLIVQSLNFFNMSDPGNKSASIKYELVMKDVATSGRLDWFYSYYATGAAEVRSK